MTREAGIVGQTYDESTTPTDCGSQTSIVLSSACDDIYVVGRSVGYRPMQCVVVPRVVRSVLDVESDTTLVTR